MFENSAPAAQNIDIHVYQTHIPLEWKARIVWGEKTITVGPANIVSILANVSNFVRLEAAYADIKVHGSEACDGPVVPRKRGAYSFDRTDNEAN